jgi:Ca-activated chloride channel family protein
MTGIRRASTALLAASVLALGLAGPAAAAGPRVAIIEPSPFGAVSGQVPIEIHVDTESQVSHVEVWVDGRLVATLRQAPWETTVDVGTENREHTFRAVAHVADGTTGEMELQTPAIEVDEVLELPLQQLFVTVSRGSGRVTDLARTDFRVVDDGQVQELVTFEGGDAPLTAVLLVDSSQSMSGERLASAVRGVEAFTAGMRELDEAMALMFADQLLRATPFTDDPAVIRSSLEGVEATGGTALTDHLYSAFKILDGRQGRRVVVVLSDGFDVYSALRMKDVLWKAQRSQAIVYWIQLQDRIQAEEDVGLFKTSWRNGEENQAEYQTLTRLVLESGGRIESVERTDQVRGAFESILQELREQYVLGYYPTDLNHDGSWRQVEVQVRGFGNSARVREGYVDF